MEKTLALSDRMKEYEKTNSQKLTRRTPVMIRIDGRAFHTFTRKFEKPFDEKLIVAMQQVTLKLCENICNAKIGYTQSDEISILMTDWDKLETQPFFDNKIQKLTSITAAMATSYFINEWYNLTGEVVDIQFDSRVFNIPEREIVNYFIWRQQDWTRNSLQMLARAHFSHKTLHGKNTSDMHEMLFTEKKVNWDSLATHLKRGTSIVKEDTEFIVDTEMPIVTQDRMYITRQYEVEE